MLTVLTATYNRSQSLLRLFDSLQSQTCSDFDWLIIDDGSTDDTEDTVNRLKSSATFNIKILKKKNQGKHSALNLGFTSETREWIFIVDSDDWLDRDCIGKITNFIGKYGEDDLISSFCLLQKNQNGENVGSLLDTSHGNYIDMINSSVHGDKCDVFKKSVVEKFSYPIFDGENFMSELPLYIWLGENTKTKFLNYRGYNCEYLNGGLSDRSIELRYKNPNSTAYVYKSLFNSSVCYKERAKSGINWWRFYSKREVFDDWKAPRIYFVFALLLRIKDQIKGVKS